MIYLEQNNTDECTFMLKIKVDKDTTFVYKVEEGQPYLNEKLLEWDISKIDEQMYHVIRNGQSYRAELISWNKEQKTFVFRIEGGEVETTVQDKFDLLLEKMGISDGAAQKMKELKAPMPGLIIGVSVEEGQKVEAGTPLIVLEAMKMENIIRAQGEGIVKKINVQTGNSVEKNQVLIIFE